MGISFKEYFAAFGKWGFIVAAIIVGDIIGIVQSVDQKFILPQLVWWLVLILILVLSPVIAFHHLRLRRDQLQKELDGIKNSRPNVVYESRWAKPFANEYYTCLMLQNRVVCPSGDISTSKHTRARIEILNSSGITIHSWTGRWSDNNWPKDYADIDIQNQRDINAGDPARLDIGFRRNGEFEFRAWYNWLPSLPEPQPDSIIFNPDSYYVKVLLWAANMAEKETWFTLQIPNVPQSNDTEQVKITPTKKPVFDKEGSHTE